MKTAIECVPCFARQAAEAVAEAEPDPGRREALLRATLKVIAESDWNGTPPEVAVRIHRLIRRTLKNDDPYRAIKQRMNEEAKRLLPRALLGAACRGDARESAVRIAIAGNWLDAGAKAGIAAERLETHLETIWETPLWGDPAALFEAAEAAHKILYLADNAGEIVFDRVLLEALPTEKITVFVRGAPVINDATLADAEFAGLPEIVPVLDNGSDAPGTILDDCSEEFRQWFKEADLIIAKGQGNYETLSDVDKPIFFLFVVKCSIVGQKVGAPVGHMIALDRTRS